MSRLIARTTMNATTSPPPRFTPPSRRPRPAEHAAVDETAVEETAPRPVSTERPGRRRSSWGRVLAVGLLVLAVGAGGWLARGRGIKSRLLRLAGISTPSRKQPPRAVASKPGEGERAVSPDARISVKLVLPNGRLNDRTVSAAAVTLARAADGKPVAGRLSISPDGQFVTFAPSGRLEPNTRYTFRIASAVKDAAGTPFLPYAVSFTTGSQPDPSIRFDKVALPAAEKVGFTCVAVGPDGRLYAGADDGRIFRYPIRSDGTLDAPEVFTSLQSANGGPRLLTGFCFDPRSDAKQPTLWAAHGWYGFQDAPDWTGKVSHISGANLQTVRDVVINLPRSIRDHLTNQPTFGPDGALYIPQASNNAFGAPDSVWGDRPERLLNATILRLDVNNLPGAPIDARTPDGGGTFDPRAPGSPLTLYAEGVRLAYDLLWHSNGHLYAPVNGSSAGGNTPAGGGAPALRDVPDSEHDWFFRIQPGRYYGHPNPAQGHFVLNGGNPTGGQDFAELPQYPVGTRPDPKWDPAVYDFGDHVSPNGIIESRSGKLKGKVLVCRYNVGSDLLCLTLDENGNVKAAEAGIAGFTGLTNPLDLAEDARTGCIYVAEYGRQCVTLLRPAKSN